MSASPTVGKRLGQKPAPSTICARVGAHVVVEASSDGNLVARFGHNSVALGRFSADAVARAEDLRTGLPLAALASDAHAIDKEVRLIVRRLASHGLLEYRLGHGADGDDVVIEPQTANYWPRAPQLHNDDVLVLSRFAYMRRRGNDMVLESPRAEALFKICDPRIATVLATLAAPQGLKQLRRLEGFFGVELLALLVDCQILFKVDPAREGSLRPDEGDDSLVLWDFHDLLFHTRSTLGRHANPLGGLYPYAGEMAPLPAVRPRWPGRKIDLSKFSPAQAEAISPAARLLRERYSTRVFDDRQPITLAELSRFLDTSARVHSKWKSKLDFAVGNAPVVAYAARPYPSGGGVYELELYLAVNTCDGLDRGFYHYDAGGHSLVPIAVRSPELDALLVETQFAMGAPAPPQILITIAARFGRVSWKYSSLAYALILKDVGVLTQTLYLMATDMGLGGCAIGSANIDLFAKMTGLEFHVEGPVGLFAIGRASKPAPSDRHG